MQPPIPTTDSVLPPSSSIFDSARLSLEEQIASRQAEIDELKEQIASEEAEQARRQAEEELRLRPLLDELHEQIVLIQAQMAHHWVKYVRRSQPSYGQSSQPSACTSTARYSPQSQSQHSLSPSTPLTSPPPSCLGLPSLQHSQPSHLPISPPSAQFSSLEDEDPPRIIRFPSLQHRFQTFYAQPTSSRRQQQRPPPSTSTPSSTRICQPSTALYSPQPQHSHSLSSTTPRVGWPPLSFTPTSSALQRSLPIPTPPTQLLSSSTPHYPPDRFSSHTATQVGGAPPSALEDPEVWEKALQGVAKPAYGMLSLSAAMLNVNAFSSNPITKVPLVIATMAAFFAVVLHWLTGLHLHVSEPAHHINHVKRPLMLLVAFLAISVFATLFALPAYSWSQEECSPYCWAERVLVSTVVIGGFASLIIGGRYMRGGDVRLAARV